jgi:hypothetical protein
MIRHLRIAIFPLVALVTPVPQGMAEGIDTQPQILTNSPPYHLARDVTEEDARVAECKADCAEAAAERTKAIREMQQRGLSKDAIVDMLNADAAEIRKCYQSCRR